MTPKKLILKNIFQHDYREIIFSDGMNAISGPNGSGKSNLLHALCLAITLELPTSSKKSDTIRDGEECGEIKFDFVHLDIPGKTHIVLKRNYPHLWEEMQSRIQRAKELVARSINDPSISITPEILKLAEFQPREWISMSMTWGNYSCRNITEYQQWLRDFVHASSKSIVSSYFPLQGDIDAMISEDNTQRMRVLAEKAGVGLCDYIWTLIGKYINSAPVVTYSEKEHAECLTIVSSLQSKADSLALELKKYQAEKTEDVEALRNKIHQLQSSLQSKTLLENLQAELSKSEQLQKKILKSFFDVEKSLASIRSQLDSLKDQHQAAIQIVVQATTYEKNVTILKTYEKTIQELQDRLRSLPEISQESSQSEEDIQNNLQSLTNQIITLQNQIHQVQHVLQVFSSGQCPTCGSKVFDESRIESLRQKYQNDQLMLQQFLSQKQQLEILKKSLQTKKLELQAQKSALELEIHKYEAALSALQAQLQNISSSSSSISLDEAREIISRFEQMQTEEKSLHSKYVTHSQELTKIQKDCESIKKQIEIVQKNALFAHLSIDEIQKQIQQYMEEISEKNRKQEKYQSLLLEYSVVSARCEDAKQKLKIFEENKKKHIKMQKYLSTLKTVRDVFHVDASPKKVIGWYVQQLIQRACDYLKSFDVSFSVSMTEDFRFVAVFPGKVIPVDKLSGGEKNILNICLRLAMTDLFPTDLQLLVLDEIEVHLDQVNVSRLPVLLEKVRAVARSKELVVLFVSHHASLRTVADRIIDISQPIKL